MAIKEGDFIRLNYTGKSNGILFDTTIESDARDADAYDENKAYTPVVICVGKQQVLPGLDEALIGKEIGFTDTIEIPPEKAFGEHEQELLKSYEKKAFNEKPTVGMRVNIPKVGEGTVVQAIGGRVVVDFNHPLAGRTLTYQFKIEEMVESAIDKLKGLLSLFAGVDAEVLFEDRIAQVILPPGIYYYNRRWLNSKPFITTAAFDLIEGLDDIWFVEKYKRPEKKEEV